MGINDLFGFSSRQLRFVALMAGTAAALGAYLFVRSHAYPDGDVPRPLPVFYDSSERPTALFQLNPNTAPLDSLELVPGIGPELAERIAESRDREPFETVDDLLAVHGIGAKTLERIKPYMKLDSDD
ncbi:MAG: helix-hairpin-helix domain-containing protein [bacterium]